MEFLTDLLTETSLILYEGSLYILAGFLIAGLIHEFLPTESISRHLGKESPRSVIMAALLGAPIPLCSCGVLPAAAALKRKGASRGSLISFLISTPETGVDSIALTYGLLGPVMAVVRPLVAVITAVAAGVVSILMPERDDEDLDYTDLEDDGCHAHEPTGAVPASDGWATRGKRALDYGFGTLMDDIAFWMVLGIGLTGLMAAILPDDFFSTTLGMGSGIVPMIAMIIVGVPLYLCASASTPVAAALIAKGLSPGAALVFLLVGPATNAATIAVAGKLLGGRRLRLYLGTIVVVSLAAGLALDAFGGESVRLTAFDRPPDDAYSLMSLIKLTAAFGFVLLTWRTFRRTGVKEGLGDLRDQFVRVAAATRNIRWRRLLSGPALGAIAAAALISMIPSAALVVGPGESGIVQTFGRVTSSELEPGLHWHLPPPLGRGVSVATDELRRVDIGYEETSTGGRLGLESEAFYLTADENIIDIRSMVQFRVTDPVRFAMRVESADLVVKSLARRELIHVTSNRSIDNIYTSERRSAEEEFHRRLAESVTGMQLGVEIVDARFLDVHAPANVHDAFRDVASALEDREREVHVAEGYAAEASREAEGEVVAVIAAAEADAQASRELAAARAHAFDQLADTHRAAPRLTEFRLRLENIETNMSDIRKYIHASPSRSAEIDLWLGSKTLPIPAGNAGSGTTPDGANGEGR